MRSYLICELKRKIISSEFLISVIAFIAVGLLNAYFNIYSTNKVGIGGLTLFIHSTVLGYSLFSYVAPIIGALPVCSKIVDSIASGYINQELARVPKRTYILTVMAFCILEFIVGWLSVAINIKTITTIQIFVQDDLRGQVIGTLTAVSYSLIPISLLLAGTAVDMVESYVIPLICGSLLVVLLGCIRLLDLRANKLPTE